MIPFLRSLRNSRNGDAGAFVRAGRLTAAAFALLTTLAGTSQAMAPEIGTDCATCQHPTAVRLPQCTGVYMGNGLVVTAAHCIANVGENSQAYFGENEDDWQISVPIAYCETHPDGEYDTNALGEDSWSGVDLAYCVLDEEVEMPPIVPPMMPAGCERDWLAHEVYETSDGAIVTAVGIGCGIHQEYWGQDCEDGVKRYAAQQLVRQTQYNGSATKLELVRDVWGDENETGVRSGDSGGPIFARLPDDTLRLIGVIHGTNGQAYAEAVPPYLHWIESASGIDITPHHSFVNGVWATAVGSAIAPESTSNAEWAGWWDFGCAGHPMKGTASYTEQPFTGGIECPGWPGRPPGDKAIEPEDPFESREPIDTLSAELAPEFELTRSASSTLTPDDLVSTGDSAAPLGFLPVEAEASLQPIETFVPLRR
jgi:hypothetical protein